MRALAVSAQETLRLRVVRVVQAGMSQAEAARVFGVSRQSVNAWEHRRREGACGR
ncbi:MAG: helix-turn-helix domain-containing protein [Nitrospirota bacterium]